MMRGYVKKLLLVLLLLIVIEKTIGRNYRCRDNKAEIQMPSAEEMSDAREF